MIHRGRGGGACKERAGGEARVQEGWLCQGSSCKEGDWESEVLLQGGGAWECKEGGVRRAG